MVNVVRYSPLDEEEILHGSIKIYAAAASTSLDRRTIGVVIQGSEPDLHALALGLGMNKACLKIVDRVGGPDKEPSGERRFSFSADLTRREDCLAVDSVG